MNDTQHIAELDLLAAQRTRLADRLKAPWWYVAGSAVALSIGCAMPLASHYVHGAGITCGALACVMILLLQRALIRASGVNLGASTGHYPSARFWAYGIPAAFIANSLLGTFLIDSRRPAAAIGVAALAAAASTICWHGHLRGIRRDLRSGRAAR